MADTFILGRSPQSPIQIPATAQGVSGQHAKITITNSGEWVLDDLDSANGTYVRNDNGDFTRVHSVTISPESIIRLGFGASSYTFMAYRVNSEDTGYTREFQHLRHQLKKQVEKESQVESEADRHGWISRLAGVAVMGICFALPLVGLDVDMTTRLMLTAAAPAIAGILFKGDKERLKEIRRRRSKVLVCPNCGYPISEFEIEQGGCRSCKAQ